MMKTHNKLGVKRMHLIIIKAIYGKPTTNILNSEKTLKFFYVRLGIR